MRSFFRSVRATSFAITGLLAACGGGGTPAEDAATPTDTGGALPDTGGSLDAAAAPDTGAEVDSGPALDGCAVTFAGCSAFVDHTGESAVSVGFAAAGFLYSPNCIRVSAGTVVTIAGSTLHPLHGATCAPTGSPLPATPIAMDGDYTFAAPGAYGYYCNNHGTNAGAGMSGLIIVE